MLKIEGLNKRFRNFQLQDVGLEVEEGEYFILLGKSGSGKSLLLEILAGLQTADSGSIILNNREISRVDIRKRNIGLLFQDYAIFPHLNVFENIAYPLKTKHFSKIQIRDKVRSLAMDFEIEHLLSRKTTKLSGGEKQRVALARTLAMEPKLLLLDEPLASLDVQLKQEIRKLFRKIKRDGQTVIHVTHDYEEAILLADKVAVINQGKIVQSGKTADVFHHPINEFVASFTGVKNFFRASFAYHPEADICLAEIKTGLQIKTLQKPAAKEGALVIRCQDIFLSNSRSDTSALNNFKGRIREVLPAIRGFEVVTDIGVLLSVMVSHESIMNMKLREGKEVWVSFKASAVKILA
ncbi:MAG: ABC transporter ATP-binding protein [Bacteroidota bacterium]|nr:ABC transporter ATP-binding protein [Bacteroidota bacterium]